MPEKEWEISESGIRWLIKADQRPNGKYALWMYRPGMKFATQRWTEAVYDEVPTAEDVNQWLIDQGFKARVPYS